MPADAKNNHVVGKVPASKQRWPISDHGFLRYQRRQASLQWSQGNKFPYQ